MEAYNAGPHNFTSDQQAQYDAAQARKAELDAEGAALQKEQDAQKTQRQKLAAEAQQLATEADQLASDEESYDADATSYDSDEQQLEPERAQLLQEITADLQEQLSSPPQEAADTAQGGDAAAPAQSAADEQAAEQAPEAAPGGDFASPVDRVAAIASYAAANGLSVQYQPVVARMSPSTIPRLPAPDTAQLPLSVGFDGLLPEPNGHYQAIDVQDGSGAPSSIDPGRAAFDDALAHGGQAEATLGGRPIVIDGTTTVPKQKIRDGGDCSRPSDTYVKYGDRDTAHGGRATAVSACLDKRYRDTHPGTKTTSEIRPPGYTWATRYAGFLRQNPARTVNNCHLLGRQLSGSGTDLRNLVTCGATGNSYVGEKLATYSMNAFEDEVAAAIEAGGTVSYGVNPVYEGDRTVPSVFLMSFTSRDSKGRQIAEDEKLVSNMALSGSRALVNLGLVVDSRTGRPVPTAVDG